MNFDDFCEKIRQLVDEAMEEGVSVTLNEVTKNNGLVLKGLMVKKPDSRLSPTVYLNQFYEMYESGTDIRTISDKITECVRKGPEPEINADIYSDYDAIKDRIIFKIVNHSLNDKLLDSIPYVKWNDLAVVFCCLMDNNCEGYATILIRNEHLKMWKRQIEDVYQAARINTPRLMDDELYTMDSIIHEIMKSRGVKCEECEEDTAVSPPMFVLSNKRKLFGAASMLYSGRIKEVSDLYGRGLYILPSSIHEVILLPEGDACDKDYIRSMIKEVNENQVDLEDRLSDNLYYYDRNTGEITIAV